VTGVVVVLGVANLVGGRFSMAASNYLGTRAEEQFRARARRNEEREIELCSEGEREEIRQIFRDKGFEGSDLERAVQIVTSDRRRWVETMLVEESGLSLQGPSPFRAAGATFAAFGAAGLIPLLPFMLRYLTPGAMPAPFVWSTFLTAAAFFGIGAAKARFVERSWYWSGLEALGIGGSAAALAFLVGRLLGGLA
jgi:VIT1/CCC1 family predicted Fe2+/Mn2+ transporter